MRSCHRQFEMEYIEASEPPHPAPVLPIHNASDGRRCPFRGQGLFLGFMNSLIREHGSQEEIGHETDVAIMDLLADIRKAVLDVRDHY